jgi:predicted AAA+ superfamily ATPase
VETIKTFGPATAFYLNGDFLSDDQSLSKELEALAVSFPLKAKVKRIFIDEITAIRNWETVLKRLVDNGTLRNILVITTGSRGTDLRRGAERLPGRKGKIKRTSYLFTPISYKSFHKVCHRILKENTLNAYLLTGGSPIACAELAANKRIPEYVIELGRNWIEGEISRAGRHRSALINILNVLFRFGGCPVGQAKLAREAGLSNNSIAQGYIELLNDLGCVIPAFPWDPQKKHLVLRKPCKYHFMNLLVASCYHSSQLRSPEDFNKLPPEQQGVWYEWAVAQELQRRWSLSGDHFLEPLAFWKSKSHEIDFFDKNAGFIEVKRGQTSPLEFAWFAKQFQKDSLKVINQKKYKTPHLHGVSLEDFLLGK